MQKRLAAALLAISLMAASCQRAPASLWFGTWSLRAEDADGKPETLIYSDASHGAMRMESVEKRSVIVTRFDGTPVADSGAGKGDGTALAVKTASPTSYSWTFWSEGKPFVQGLNTLAADRRSFTEVSWLVDKPDHNVTLVYLRK